MVCIRESTKPIFWSKWGQFDRAKPIFKILLASWAFYIIEKGFRSFNSENLGSVGQRAAKLQAIKLWEWFNPARSRMRAKWFECGRGRVADFFLRTPTLTASNFAALWPIDLEILAIKDLLFFSQCIEFQGAGSILKVSFALSKWPHFHRVYLVTVCKRSSIAF